ncbi:MAG: hypothetical protein IKF90_25765, partial [Parasporobacterium sp.]|nr:hypothetical protein [Parasporobacterium sp.]
MISVIFILVIWIFEQIKYANRLLTHIATMYRASLDRYFRILIAKSLLFIFIIAHGKETNSIAISVDIIIPYNPIIGVSAIFKDKFTPADISGLYLSCFHIPPASLKTIRVRGASSANRYNAKRITNGKSNAYFSPTQIRINGWHMQTKHVQPKFIAKKTIWLILYNNLLFCVLSLTIKLLPIPAV